MSAKSVADWDAIEPHFRAGIRSLKDMGNEFGVSDVAILKHAKRYGWDRNLKAKIQAKADAKVSAAMVSAEVREIKTLTESARVEVEAEVQARIRLSHRADIGKYRALAKTLLEELEFQTGNQDLFAELLDLVIPVAAEDDSKGEQDRVFKLRAAFEKAISLGGRTKTIKDLTDTLKTLVGLEREAYGLAEAAAPKDPEDFDLTEVARRMAFVLASAASSPSTRTLQ